MDSPITNPLLDFSGLPRFDQVRPAHVTPAMDVLLANGRALVEKLGSSQDAPSWDNFARPLEDMEEHIGRAWSQVSHMNAVVNSPELREAYNDNLPKLTAFYADLSQDERLYARFRGLQAKAEFSTFKAGPPQNVEKEMAQFQ